MNLNEILKFNFIQQKHDGIIEIHTHKCMNAITLEKVFVSLDDLNYELVKIFPGLVRAFKKQS